MIKLLPWDPAEDLETEDDMKEYLEAALELDDDPWIVALVLWDISRAKGGEEIAISAGFDRASVHKSEKRGDVLDFRAVMEAAQALGLRLYAGAASCGESEFEPNANGGAAKTRRPPPSPNCKPSEGLVVRLNSALDRCDAWEAARALRDIAAARGMERVVSDAWADETPDFAAFMDAARALGLRIHAAVARDDGRRRGGGDWRPRLAGRECGKVVFAKHRGAAENLIDRAENRNHPKREARHGNGIHPVAYAEAERRQRQSAGRGRDC